jgi:TonB family protein
MKSLISLILLTSGLQSQSVGLPIPLTNPGSYSCVYSPNQTDPNLNPAPPTFKGGQEALIRFIQANLQYPDDAKQAGLQGIVYVRARVLTSGRLDSLSLVYSRGKQTEESLGEEALRIVRLMPAWKPANNAKGQLVPDFVLIPFRFKLSPDK